MAYVLVGIFGQVEERRHVQLLHLDVCINY
jgi:hypothetical protein